MTRGDEAAPPLRRLPRRGTLWHYVRSGWKARELIIAMAINDHRAQHKRMLLGAVWHLLDPLLRIAIYAVVFGAILGPRRPDGYLAFLTVGVFLYRFLQAAISQGATTLDHPEAGLRELGLPRILLPASAVFRNVLTLAPDLILIVGIVVFETRRFDAGWVVFLLAVLPVTVLLAFGGALVAARLTLAIRDVNRVLPHIFHLGFWVSGVMFPVSAVTDVLPGIAPYVALNPAYAVLSLARDAVVAPVEGTSVLWASALGWTVALLGLGLLLTYRSEGRATDA